MRRHLLFCALGALLGCRQVAEPSGTAIALFCSTSEQSKTDILTQDDEIAVFARIEGTESCFLEAVKFTVKADGHSLMTAPAVAYPETNQAIHFFAYFPYHMGAFSVPTDQSQPEALKQADLCGAVASTTPVATPVALEFRHLMARVVITTNKPTEKITFPNALTSGVLHAATAELVLGAERKDIWTEKNELIVPVQPLSRLVLTVAGVEYVFDGSVSLEAGKTTTLDLTLHPSTKTATLSGSSIADWVSSASEGNPTQAAVNTLTIYWPKCHPQSGSVDKVVLRIKDQTTNTTADYTVSSGIAYADQTFTVPFASTVVFYPYTIEYITLYRSGAWLHESANVVGGTMVKKGVCVVGVRQPLNPPTSSDYVTVGSLRWAKGNLVAKNTNECKVGASTDYGVYFQFGSLVGWSGGGSSGSGVGQGSPTLDKAVWPMAMGATKPAYAWQNVNIDGTATLAHYYFNYAVAPWNAASNNSVDIGVFKGTVTGEGSTTGTLRGGRYANLGVGDPCTYYLGGGWRLPLASDYTALFAGVGNNTAWGSVAGWTWRATPPGANGVLFIPASGYRNYSDGSFGIVASYGYCWSSSVSNATLGFYLYFDSGTVYPQNSNSRSYGFPVRCVSN